MDQYPNTIYQKPMRFELSSLAQEYQFSNEQPPIIDDQPMYRPEDAYQYAQYHKLPNNEDSNPNTSLPNNIFAVALDANTQQTRINSLNVPPQNYAGLHSSQWTSQQCMFEAEGTSEPAGIYRTGPTGFQHSGLSTFHGFTQTSVIDQQDFMPSGVNERTQSNDVPRPQKRRRSASKDYTRGNSTQEHRDAKLRVCTQCKRYARIREHLRSLMQSMLLELEYDISPPIGRGSQSAGEPDLFATSVTSSSPKSPVLPSSTSTSPFLDSGTHFQNDPKHNNPVAIKAVEDWIAKTRERLLHEFDNVMGIGGTGIPKSYIVEEDSEGSESGDDESDDAQRQPDKESQLWSRAEHCEVGMTYHEDVFIPGQQQLGDQSPISSIETAMYIDSNTVIDNAPSKKGGNNDKCQKPASLPVRAAPFGLLGSLGLSLMTLKSTEAEPEEDKGPGIASPNFFTSTWAPDVPSHLLESAQCQAPTILTRGVISPPEAEKLFAIYFTSMNLSVSLLDPILYTAQRTFYRSPFLFTVICAIASRFYMERSDLYPKMMQYAQLAAGTALVSGNKNVEMCQAYILLSLYPVPAQKWEDQRSWLYLGVAIRTATDLNLHILPTAKPLNEYHAREMLNRTRVWMNCLNLDRSTGSQYGKPPIIKSEDYIANHIEDWWKSSPCNMKDFDIHICAYNSELKVMATFIANIHSNPEHPTGLNKGVDFERIAIETDDELQRLRDKWFAIINAQTDMNDSQNSFRTGLLRLAYSYSRLVALSYGFQHAFGKMDGVDENPFLMRCLKAAFDVVDAVVHDICRPSQVHFFSRGPEAQSVFTTFASAFLLKLLQPKFASYLTSNIRREICEQVQKVVDLLASPQVAIDDRHGPKLYSRFLAKLLQTPLYKQSSPETDSSLSPPPTETAHSFDSFALFGRTGQFVNYMATVMDSPAPLEVSSDDHSDVEYPSSNGTTEWHDIPIEQPSPLNDIVQGLWSLMDSMSWQAISSSGFDHRAQLQQSLGLDPNNPASLDQFIESLSLTDRPGATNHCL